MRRALASIQLLAFGAVGVALVAPDVPRLVQHWSDATIYPWWAAIYVVVGVVASAVSMAVRDERWAGLLATLVVVPAGQLAGLGFVAVKHWRPSFGMAGGFAGCLDQLRQLAWVIGLAGTVAVVAAIVQLASLRAFPIRTSARTALLFAGIGLLVLLALPYGIAGPESELHDLKSLGAFVLIYSGPIGLTVAGAGWLVERLRWSAIAACAVAAAVSALQLITDLSFGRGRPALAATAAVLAVLALGSRSASQRATRQTLGARS